MITRLHGMPKHTSLRAIWDNEGNRIGVIGKARHLISEGYIHYLCPNGEIWLFVPDKDVTMLIMHDETKEYLYRRVMRLYKWITT